MRDLVVMPSIRRPVLEYLGGLLDDPDVDVLVVDDSDGGVGKAGLPRNVRVVDYADRAAYLGSPETDLKHVPRKTPACKAFGLYYGWREGYDRLFLLDDDCDTRAEPDYRGAVPVGRVARCRTLATPSGWVNTMTAAKGGASALVARGYPYEHRDEPSGAGGEVERYVAFNQGMWSGTPDVNGIDKLRLRADGSSLVVTDPAREWDDGHTALLPGQRLPHSVMNAQMLARLAPAFPQFPDYRFAGHVLRRHDDVWAAYVLKAVMDSAGDVMTFGRPVVCHVKEGDTVREALSEHLTNLCQPHFTAAVDRAARGLRFDGYARTAYRLGERMMAQVAQEPPPGRFATVVYDCAERVKTWAELFLAAGAA